MATSRRTLPICLALVVGLILAGLPSSPRVSAATIVAANVFELITAIHTANGTAEADEIVLGGGTYSLVDPWDYDGFLGGPNGLPPITSEITITGNGATIERAGAPDYRLLEVVNTGTLHLNDVTISGGSIATFGGGVYNSGTLTLTDTTIRGNWADFGGGGIYNTGALTLTNSTVSGNSAAGGEGGGIYNVGSMTLTESTVSDNSAGIDGGGIYNNVGTMTLTESTVSGNNAGIDGGGIFNVGTMTLTDSTVSGNNAGIDGGAIANTGTLTLTNSTVSGNSTTNGGGIVNTGTLMLTNSTVSGNSASGEGGGNLNVGTMTLTNTIVAGNSAQDGPDVLTATVVDGGHNLIGDGSGMTGLAHGSNGNQVGTTVSPIDPLLGPLQGNGGPTLTMALLEGSPAIDAGNQDATGAPAADQRGITRPQGDEGDIGAFEVEVAVSDSTPPDITPSVSGTLGANGWFTSDVSVTWSVSDPESTVTDTNGCDPVAITSDTTETILTCNATSAGGMSSTSVTVRRDTTAPVITYNGNLGTYGMNDTIAITCVASDATSGVAADDCAGISGSGMSFGPGVYTFSASATDQAGNTGSGSTTFTVGATYDALCDLTKTVVRNASAALAACAALAIAKQAAATGNVLVEQLATVSYVIQIWSAVNKRYASAADGQMLLEWARSL